MESITNEEIDEAITILEEETKRRVEDIQQRVEFICASLRAQGNTQINRMLMSVRQLTIKEFCEYYEADTKKFLEQQAKQRFMGGGSFEFNSSNRKQRLGRNENIFVEQRDPTETKKRRTSSPKIERQEAENTLHKVTINKESDKNEEEINERNDESVTKIDEENDKNDSKINKVQEDVDVDAAEKNNEQEDYDDIDMGDMGSKEISSSLSAEEVKEAEINAILSEEEKESSIENNQSHQHVDIEPLLIHLTRQDHPEITLRLDPKETVDNLGTFAIEKPSEEIWARLDEVQKSRIREQIQVLQDELDSLMQCLS
ncbi:MAG: hypothetical protein EXX96DRAFT_548248 [Benjaminiella poitrasii]|nr:MAG: hypothetical protein EXX96DRAFT_548248 [Benjaminiella poitrasii]